MQNEELEYQKFMAKTMRAGLEFKNDYNNLSPNNKARFQQDLKNQILLAPFRNMLKSLLGE